MFVRSAYVVMAAALANPAIVPVQTGVYVRGGVECRDAPFAAQLTYDGNAFSGPHSSNCASVLLRRIGKRYDLKMTCHAAGDGSPQPPYTETQVVTVVSASRLNLSHPAGTGRLDRADYRLCAGLPKQSGR